MEGWEYKNILFEVTRSALGKISYDAAETDHVLNELGNEGWEAFAVSPLQGGQGFTAALIHHLRRPKTSQRTAGFASGR